MAPNRRVAPQRREQIVQAAIQCLARDGYARLTMKTLAQEAGLSQGILHYYFADKAAILAAVLESVTADLNHRLHQAQQAHLATPKERLQAVVRTCLETARTCPELWRVLIQLWGEMMHDEHLSAINVGLYTTMRRQIAALLMLGVRQGAFRRVNVEETAAVILGLVDGMALQLTFDPQAIPMETAVTCCCEAVERFLSPQAEGQWNTSR